MTWQSLLLLALTGQSPVLAWLARQHFNLKGKLMLLDLDPVKDAEFIASFMARKSVENVTARLREVLSEFASNGVSRADVAAALRQLADETAADADEAVKAVEADPAAPVYQGPEVVVDPPQPPAPPAAPAPAEAAPAAEEYQGPEVVVDPPQA